MMRQLFLLLALMVATILSADKYPLEQLGYLDVTTVAGVDPTGESDSTVGLNEALRLSRERSLLAFFPAGTYLVSDTIRGDQIGRRLGNGTLCGGNQIEGNVVMVGSTAGERRPVIRLQANAIGFGHPMMPRPVVHIRLPMAERPTGERPNCTFGCGLRGIDIDLGEHNRGAVGVYFGGAQESFLQDVRINARDGLAGFMAVPGRGMSASNLEVVGGSYGLWLPEGHGGPSLGCNFSAIRLIGQRIAAIHGEVSRGTAMVGFHLEAERGPVLITAGSGIESGHWGLYDGTIRLTHGGPVIDNAADRFLAMKQVCIEGADTLVTGVDLEVDLLPMQAVEVEEFLYTPVTLVGERQAVTQNWEDGRWTREPIISVRAFSGELPDRVAPHRWDGAPSFEDSGVRNILAFGATANDGSDDTAAVKAAIDAGGPVFVPAGIFDVSDTLTLGFDTQLFGIGGRKSVLRPHASWQPKDYVWLIETVDDAAARTTLSDLQFATTYEPGDRINAVHWRAGRHSVVRNVRDQFTTPMRTEVEPWQVYRIDGHGGGRWYSWTEHYNIRSGWAPHPDFRKLVVDGTHEPLTFYGFNPEHGGAPWRARNAPFTTFREARNVRIFGMKAESNGPVMELFDVRDFFAGMLFTIPKGGDSDLILIKDSTNLELQGIAWPLHAESTAAEARGALINDAQNPSSSDVGRESFIGRYRRGSVAW